MRIINKMKKTMLVLAASLFCANVAFADTQTVYSWESPEGTPAEVGGKVASSVNSWVKNGEIGVTEEHVNLKQTVTDLTVDPNVSTDYWVLRLSGNNSHIDVTDQSTLEAKDYGRCAHVVITLDEPLAEGDLLTVTGFRNKNAADKVANLYIRFDGEAGKLAELKDVDDETPYANVHTNGGVDLDNDGNLPTSKTYTVPAEAAGAKKIIFSRSKSGTNVYVSKVLITREAAADNSAELVAAVDSLNKLIVEAETWKATLNAEDEMHAQVLGMLDQMIPAAKAVAEAPESLEAVNQMIFDVYVTLGTYKPMIEQYDAKMAANTAIEEAKALLATYSNYTDEAGFAAAIAAAENALVDVNTGMGTLEDLNAAVEAMAAAQEAFVAENAAPDTEYVLHASWNFRDTNVFPADTRVAVASLTEQITTLANGIILYKSTQEEFDGLIFEPSRDDNTKSWWVRNRRNDQYGLAAVNQTRWFAIQNVYEGFKVTIEANAAMPLADSTMVSEIKQNETTSLGVGVSYTYTIAKAGAFALYNAGVYMYNITVEAPVMDLMTEKEFNFRDAEQFAKDTRVAVASLTTAHTTLENGIVLYESTQDEFAGLIFEPSRDDNTKSWWVRPRNNKTDYGLAAINQTRWFGVKDLKAGYKVTVESKSAMPLADSTMVSSIVQNEATACGYGVSYTYTMAKEGVLAFYNAGCYMYRIAIQKPVTYYESTVMNFRDAEQFAKDTRVAVASLTTEYATMADGTVLYESTQEEFAGLAFQPAKNDGTQSWWVRPRNNKTDYGLAAINLTRWFAVTGLQAGEYVTVESKSAMPLADSTMVAEIVQNETTQCGYGVSYTYKMAKSGYLAFSNNGCYMYYIEVKRIGGALAAPKFNVTGNYYDVNTVEITCDTEGALIYYNIDGGETFEYTAPFTVDASCKLSAWSELNGNKSTKTNKSVTAGYVDAPTASITGVQGTTRIVELACALEENIRLYYTTDTTAVDYKMYVAPIHITDTTDVWAYAVYTNVDRKKFTSDTLKAVMAAGTDVALNAPTFAKAVVDSLTQIEYAAKNLSAYIINSDQSSVLCAPEAKLSYEFYPLNAETGRIADMPSKKGAYAVGDTLFALPLGKLVAKAMAGGYETAEAYTWLKAPAQLTPIWEIDFDTLAATYAVEGDVTPTQTDVVFNGNFRATSTSDFSNVVINDVVLPTGFAVQTGTSWLLRNKTAENSVGLYNYNSGVRAFGFAGLKKNQVVKVSYQDAAQAIFVGGVMEQDIANSNGNDICYNVTADGNATVGMNRYYTIHKVGVYISSALTQTPDFAITKVDGETHYVSMTSGSLGADIYYAFGTEEYSESQVLANDTTGGVEPVYETKIDTTVVYGEAALYTEPVALKKTTWVRAYALYQDVESEAREQKIEAGYAVQIAQPIISYAGKNEAGQKLFTISVDNSEVISAPTTPIYYTLPNGREMMYNGGNITVSNDVYGWMTAVAKLAGYEDSKVARRYIDARESYTEKYEVVDAALETMPVEAGDIEVDYSVDMNVEQLGATAYAGRIYFHRTVDAAVINVSLPGAFNSNGYVTDAAGKKLERGVDYVIFEINAAETPIQGVLEGNMAASAAKGYVVNFLNAELIGQEVIFVSAAKGNIAKANFTYTQPAEGYKVLTNRMFAPATMDIPAYVMNAEGTAFELVETGAVVAPFQSVILASADICASVKSLAVIADGIESIATDGKEVKEIKYYTVGGVEVEKPAAGVYVQQIVFTDGTAKTVTVAGK